MKQNVTHFNMKLKRWKLFVNCDKLYYQNKQLKIKCIYIASSSAYKDNKQHKT